MIFVERKPPSPRLADYLMSMHKKSQSFDVRSQLRYRHDLFSARRIIEELATQFNYKCAYCEQSTPNGQIDRFRPRRLFPHLEFDWNNLYYCCHECNARKSDRFIGKNRKAIRSSSVVQEKLLEEEALLLDPCSEDPQAHLKYDKDGQIYGITEKGRVTVEILSLNRKNLLLLRKDASQLMYLAGKNKKLIDEIVSNIRQPFLGFLQSLAPRNISFAYTASKNELNKAKIEQEEFARVLAKEDAVRLKRSKEREVPSSIRYIEKIQIQNIGPIKHLDLHLRTEIGEYVPWLMILGDNGVGKSTILKAIAFALGGDKIRKEVAGFATGLLPHNGVGRIMIQLSGLEPVEIVIDPKRKRLLRSFGDAQVPVLGYGATRLLPTKLHGPKEEKPYARLRNLFDPFSPLVIAEKWLLDLSPIQFNRVAATLKIILGLPEQALFKRSRNSVHLHGIGNACPIEHLSDGFQSVIALAVDIMSVLVIGEQEPETAEAIVLLDELGNHLHPSWRIRMVPALRQAFPKVQFIATTHEPLCLRGLRSEEIVVLKRDSKNNLLVLDQVPETKGLLVDQLLSSKLFNLDSTLDAEVDRQFKKYFQLIAMPKRSKKEESELEKLKETLKSERMLGNSPREEAMLLAIDEYWSKRGHDEMPINPKAIPPELAKKLNSILASVSK